MQINPLLIPIKKDSETIRITVLTNVVKMLSNRKWIKHERIQPIIDELTNTHNDNQIYKINLDVELIKLSSYEPAYEGTNRNFTKGFNDQLIVIKMLPQRINSISKTPIMVDFLNNYKNVHKILITEDIADKIKYQIMSNKLIEVFREPYFMINLIDHVCSPQYEVIDPANEELLLKTYNLKRKQLKKMFDFDPASQYFFLKRGQIVRIIRNSEISGTAVDYRIVIRGTAV